MTGFRCSTGTHSQKTIETTLFLLLRSCLSCSYFHLQVVCVILDDTLPHLDYTEQQVWHIISLLYIYFELNLRKLNK